MKSQILIFTLLVIACLVEAAPSSEKELKCNEVKGDLSLHYKVCGKIKCAPDGLSWSTSGCAEYRCLPGKQIGYKEGKKGAAFPECCSNPICAP